VATSNIRSIETLIELLRRRVGSPVSHTNLAGDLQCDAKTVQRWVHLVGEAIQDCTYPDGMEVRGAAQWLARFDLRPLLARSDKVVVSPTSENPEMHS